MFDAFKYLKADFKLVSTADTTMPGWIGAVLRNNFMYAAESVIINQEKSFRTFLNESILPEEHPLHSELKNSMPKGFYFRPTTYTVEYLLSNENIVPKGQLVDFSVVLFGNMEQYINIVRDIVKSMCERGFGNPVTPFELVYENIDSTTCLHNLIDNKLSSNHLNLVFNTPTELINTNNFPNENLTFKDITSGFPSFYLIVKAVMTRIEKLNAIYCDSENIHHYQAEHEQMLKLIATECRNVFVSRSNLQWLQCQSTPKKGLKEIIPLCGYKGEIQFRGRFDTILPYLQCAQYIGIGRNVAYGNGSFNINL